MTKPSFWLFSFFRKNSLSQDKGGDWLQFYGKLCWKCSRALWYWWQLKWSLQWLYEKFVLTANTPRTWDIDCWMIGLLLHFKRVVTFPPMFSRTSGIQLPFKQNLLLKLYELLYSIHSLKWYGTPMFSTHFYSRNPRDKDRGWKHGRADICSVANRQLFVLIADFKTGCLTCSDLHGLIRTQLCLA